MQTEVQRMLDAAKALAPAICGRSDEIESARRVPADLVEELRRLGIFRMFVHRDFGGAGLDIPSSLPILETLAAADGAVGWTAMVNCHAPILAGLMPRATVARIYAGGPDIAWANSLAAGGMAEVVDGGYRAHGRWPFASGCAHAQWMFALALVTRDGLPQPGPMPGMPLMRCIALPASAWTIEDTWFASGLKGSGSSHIALADTFVPEDQTFDPFFGVGELNGAVYRAPMATLPVHFAATAIGVAQAALADIVALAATGKRPTAAAQDLKDSPVFHQVLGQAQADVAAARAYVHAQSQAAWQAAEAGPIGHDVGLAVGQASAWAGATCARAVNACYAAGGGSVVYDASPLQRRLRDIHAITQHKTLNAGNLADAGAAVAQGSAESLLPW